MGAIPVGVVLLHPSTVASLPAGWVRETAFDGRFAKSWGAEAPNVGGGAAAHAHVGALHTHAETDNHGHSVSLNASGACANYGGSPNQDPIAQCNHAHPAATINGRANGNASTVIAYPSTTNNNRPPWFDFIFIKPDTHPAAIPVGLIALWNSASLPSNWLACTDGINGAPALGNKYSRGKDTGGDGGSTGGSLTHTHDLSHNHTTTHYHTGNSATDDNHPTRSNSGGGGGNKTGSHSHAITLVDQTIVTDTATLSITSGTVEPNYKKLLAIQRQSSGVSLPRGLIALWLGDPTTPPAGFKICNGQAWEDGVTYTPDMRDFFLKIANDTSEIGNTGGSNTHSHVANNSHSHSNGGAHSHGASVGSSGGSTNSGGSTSPPSHNHSANVGNNDSGLTWDAQQIAAAESVDNQPEYLTAVFIQLTKVSAGAAGLMV